jgi:hypothetical protein
LGMDLLSSTDCQLRSPYWPNCKASIPLSLWWWWWWWQKHHKHKFLFHEKNCCNIKLLQKLIGFGLRMCASTYSQAMT